MRTQLSQRTEQHTLITRFSTTPLKTQRKVHTFNQQPLLKVQSPSTSLSPFRNKKDTRVPLKTLNQQLPPKSPCNNNNSYYRKQTQNSNRKEDILDETINKLNFLERKIAAIMHKNDELRSHLRKTQQNTSIDKYQYYLSHPVTQKARKSQELQITMQSNASPEPSMISQRDRSTSKNSKFSKTIISQIKEKIINGRGKKYYENGFLYEGDFYNGLREGNGTLSNSKGDIIYQGQWKTDQFNGRGVFNNLDWFDDELIVENFKQFKAVQHQFTRYEGEFKDGQFDGKGTMTFKGCECSWIMKGQFAIDTFHGLSTLYHNSDELLKGKWLYGCFV